MVADTYRMIWRHAGSLLRFAAPIFLIVFGLNLAFYAHFGVEDVALGITEEILDQSAEISTIAQLEFLLAALDLWFGATVVTWSLSIFISFLFVPFIVRCYRLYLLGPETAARDGLFALGKQNLGVLALLGLSVLVGEFALMLQIYLYLEFMEFIVETKTVWLTALLLLQILFVPVYFLGVMIAVFRLVLLFPRVALGQPWDWTWSWRAFQEAQNFIRFLLNFIAAMVPVYLVAGIAADLVDTVPADSLLRLALEAAVDAADGLIMIAVVHGVIANAYRTATGRQSTEVGAQGPTGQGKFTTAT